MLQRLLIATILALCVSSGNAIPLPTSPRADAVNSAIRPHMFGAMASLPARPGTPLYIRIFKEERELELWVAGDKGYRLFKTYSICAISGSLGPKLATGDNQAPEGFYKVTPDRLNPSSFFHLSMNIGYPNDYDREKKHTGAFIMIHGKCVSAGCFAMTDQGIDEIYTLVHATLAAGADSIPVHIYPFRMTAANFNRHATDRWQPFWQELKPAYDAFEASKQVPPVTVLNGHYIVDSEAAMPASP